MRATVRMAMGAVALLVAPLACSEGDDRRVTAPVAPTEVLRSTAVPRALGDPRLIQEGEECHRVGDALVCSSVDEDSDAEGWIAFGLWMLSAVLCVYAGRDMERRGQSNGAWGAIVFFGGPFGILAWRLARRGYPILPPKPKPTSPYGPGVRPGSLPWNEPRDMGPGER